MFIVDNKIRILMREGKHKKALEKLYSNMGRYAKRPSVYVLRGRPLGLGTNL